MLYFLWTYAVFSLDLCCIFSGPMLYFFWTYAIFSLIVFSVKVTQPLKQKHSACSFNPYCLRHPKVKYKQKNVKCYDKFVPKVQKWKCKKIRNRKVHNEIVYTQLLSPFFLLLQFFPSYFLVCIIWLFCRNKKMRIK